MLHLVRHGLPAFDAALPPHEWGLDGTGLPAIRELRDSGRLPADARWFSSPEPKSLATALRLTDTEVVVVADLREHERASAHWIEDPVVFRESVDRAFGAPDQSASPGWEPLGVTRDRVVPAVRQVLADHPDDDLVLVGHGTAWTLVVAALTDAPPDLDAWAALKMPDLWVLDAP